MKKLLTAGFLALGLGATAFAEQGTDVQGKLDALESQVKQQAQELQQLRAAKDDTWLNERRAEEIKTLVREVLADADTRASLQEGGMTAGHNGKHFFLASDDGNFLLNFNGQAQFRYIYNSADRADRELPANSDNDEDSFGFQNRRTKIRFDGHLFDPKFTYAIQFNAAWGSSDEALDAEDDIGYAGATENSGGMVFLEDAWFAYDFADGWNVRAGQFKAPFAREELVDSKYQLAIERSYAADYFTIDRTQGVQVSWAGEICYPVRIAAMLHDGTYMANSNYDADLSDFAIATRAEMLLAGSWDQFDDYAAWSDAPFGLMVGAAVDYEANEGGFGVSHSPDIFKYTADINLEIPDFYGFNALVAFYGQNLDSGSSFVSGSSEQFGVVGQVGAFVIPDKMDVFFRYEYIDFDNGAYAQSSVSGGDFGYSEGGNDYENLNIITVGTNYYFKKHAAKFSLDVMAVLDPVPFTNSGAGITRTEDSNSEEGGEGDIFRDTNCQTVIRAQFQFLF